MPMGGYVTVRELTCTSNSATEMGYHFSFSMPSPSPALKKAGYPFPTVCTEEFVKNCVPAVKLS